MTKEDILQALREVHHPAKADRDIVEIGMVHDIEMNSPSAATPSPNT